MIGNKTKRNLALIMITVTAVIWGTGFLMSNIMLNNGFGNVPITLNAMRFVLGSLVLVAVFCTKIKLNKQIFLYGCVGGVMLFGGFGLQLAGLNYTTPASCGFFTASYVLFVPFIAWAFLKKRPTLSVWLGIGFALCGLVVMNIPTNLPPQGKNELLGNLMTLGGALFFALQIVWADKALNDKHLDSISLTVVQVVTCALTFVVASLIFDSKSFATLEIDWAKCWWPLAIVGIFGTAYAYFSQTYAQNTLSPTETSIIIACESPIGAVLSVLLGVEKFSWQVCVGGILILAAVVCVDIIPGIIASKKAKREKVAETEPSEEIDQTPDETGNNDKEN